MKQEKNIFVVKIGSNTLISENGKVREEVIRNILSVAAEIIKKRGRVILVTSGAVKLGKNSVKGNCPVNIYAGAGQMELFYNYQVQAKKLGLLLAELLLARPHLSRRSHFLKFKETLAGFFQKGIVPLINENDALVAETEWGFGDNDSLASSLAIVLKASKLIILSHVDGLYQEDSEKNRNLTVIAEVENVNEELIRHCSGAVSTGGRGGMVSKLKAIRICTATGIEVQIVNGLKPDNLKQALKGQQVGTIFKPRRAITEINDRERWILAAKNSTGSLEVDEGAGVALKKGKSLLAVGVKNVYGSFQHKEIIEILDAKKQGLAFGIIDFSDVEIKKMMKENNIYNKQLMHADNIIIFE